jgi:hypothetical protein
VTTFFDDSDLIGAGETTEGEVELASEFTIPAATVTPRWRWPAVTPLVTPTIKVWDDGGSQVGSPRSFLSTSLDAWNSVASVALAAGTYRFSVNTNRYVFKLNFAGGGPVTRGSVTYVQGRFGSPGSAPTSTSTATYFIDIDVVPDDGGLTQALPVAVETSAAQPLGRSKSRILAVATTVEAALTLGRVKSRALPVALEADVALPLGGGAGPGRDLDVVLGVPVAARQVGVPGVAWSFGVPEV